MADRSEKSGDGFDVVVIGAGPGGYVAAIRAAQLGMKVACVDRRGSPGGTCLNVGCIPSKALLHSSERFAEARDAFAGHGIKVAGVELDLAAMMKQKEKAVQGLTRGVELLFKKNAIEYVRGQASLAGPSRVRVRLADGGERDLDAARIIIATGSEPSPLDGIEVDEERIVSSTGALSLDRVPARMVVIGAGVIGLELGSVWSRLGARVTVIEFLDEILPGMDGEIRRQTRKVMAKQGLEFRLSTRVTGARTSESGVQLTMEPREGGEGGEGGETTKLEADVVLVAIGRRPFTEGLGLAEVGVETDDRGFIRIDGRFQTSVPEIYAIGDCVPGPMLAHKAEDEGIACAEMIAGQSGHVDYNLVPAVVYTWPEVASVGVTEEALKDEGVHYKVGKFPFQANSRGRTIGETDGFVKILADAGTDRVLGVHILGPLAGDLIMEAVIAMEFGASSEDIARTCHHHPGMGEAVKEAALAVHGRPIHI